MTATKGAIIRTIEQMDDNSAIIVLDWLKQHFSPVLPADEWDEIQEEAPDEWDLEMLQEINKNPDCHVFITESELDFRRANRKASA